MDTKNGTLATNPFTPAFGTVPAFMAGREHIITAMLQALDAPNGSPDLCSVFVGARGTGKTALLTYLAHESERRGWVTANVTATPGMLDDITQRTQESAVHLLPQPKARSLSSFGVPGFGSISWDNVVPTSGNWRTQMNTILDQLAEKDAGLLITVDEVDPALEEMEQLVTTYQHFVREGRRVALLMAGLPHRVSALLSGGSTSFLRRAARHDLGPIPDYEVEESFRLTVESASHTISDGALSSAVNAIGGFPFMFQLVGYRSWNAAGMGNLIDAEAVQRGISLARAELKDRVFNATIAELSRGDLAFLDAMARIGARVPRAELAELLHKSSSYISTYKKRLLETGVIEEPQPGLFTFALPTFRDYLLDRANKHDPH